MHSGGSVNENLLRESGEAKCAPADPERFKVEIETALEMTFKFAIMISGGGSFLMLILFFNSMYAEPRVIYDFLYLAIVLAILCFAFFRCADNTDNFYIIDSGRSALLYHFKFFASRDVSVAARFDELDSIAVAGESYTNKGHTYWYYVMYAVKKNGEAIALSNSVCESDISGLNARAEAIASVAGCRFLPGAPCRGLVIGKSADGSADVSVESGGNFESPLLRKFRSKLATIVIVMLVADLFVVTAFVIYFMTRAK